MNIEVKVWGKTPDGKDIKLYTLTNANGVKVQLSDIGAGIVSIITPDRYGHMEDIVLGYPALVRARRLAVSPTASPMADSRSTTRNTSLRSIPATANTISMVVASVSPTRNGPAASTATVWCSPT